MAFGFLKDALGLAGAAVGVGSLFGMGRDKGSRQMNELASRQAAIAEALANPNSPMLQQARAQAMEQSRTAQLQALRDYMTQSQRQARRFQSGGRASFYAGSPRRDEAISRAMMQMGQNEAARADQAARAQLLGSAQAYGSALQGLGGVADRACERLGWPWRTWWPGAAGVWTDQSCPGQRERAAGTEAQLYGWPAHVSTFPVRRHGSACGT